MRNFFTFIFLFVFIAVVNAQTDNWTVYNSNTSQITSNLITAIVIDQQDIKWIGTQQGLSKFNGSEWTNYNTSNSGLPNNFITCITIDPQGNKWIGTYEGGLVKFDEVNWTVYNTTNSGIPANYITCITLDSENNKWIGTFWGGVTKFDENNWTIYNTSNSNIARNSVEKLVFDNNMNLWIGHGDYGISKYDGTNWTNWKKSNSELPADLIRSLAIDELNNKWIGTESGLAKFDESNWTVYNNSNSIMSSNVIHSIAIDSYGSKWIGTGEGLYKFDDANWIVYNSTNSGLPGNLIKSITFDANRDIWIGTFDKGVAVYKEFGLNYALQFDGIDDYINAGNNSSLQILGDITIEAWIKINALPTLPFAEIIQRVGVSSEEFEEENTLFTLAISDSGRIDAFHETGNGINVARLSTRTIQTGDWVHVAIVRNTANMTYEFFINGVGESPTTYDTNPTSGTNSTTFIGANPTLPFNGIIDEIRVWNKTRTEEEIYTDMNRTLIGNEINLAAYWRFDEGTGNTIYDASGNGNTGTLMNSPIWVISDFPTSIKDINAESILPLNYILKQNYPNPFNPSTTIRFSVPSVRDEYIRPLQTRLIVYDILGREVATLVDTKLQPGNHEVKFDGSNLSSGIYFYRLTDGKFTETKKMMLLK